jgi:small-conductance mechanosensitive channel
VGIPYETDTSMARQAVLEAIQTVPGIVADPAAMVGFSSFGDANLQLSTFFWIDVSKTNPLIAKDEALTRIKTALENKGIHNSLPAQIVYLQTQN